MRGGWVYLLANRYRGTIYTGVTAKLAERTWQHREGSGSKFAARYGVTRLVHAEHYPTIEEAIARESGQEMAARVENRADRARQSGMAGSVRSTHRPVKEAGFPRSRE